MKPNIKRTLPKTADEIQNGGVYIQRVRCGKSNCKCAKGEKHTAFYFFIYRNGKNFKFYVRKSEVEAFSRMVAQANEERRRKRQAVKVSAELLSKFRAELCKNQALIKTLRGNEGYD